MPYFKKRRNMMSNLLLVAPNGKLLFEDEGSCTTAMTTNAFLRILEKAATRRTEPDKKQTDGDAPKGPFLRRALLAMETEGALLTGRLARQNPVAGFGMGADFVGTVRVSFRRDGTQVVLAGEGATLKLTRRDDKFRKELTWTGDRMPTLGRTVAELTLLADPAGLARHIRDVKGHANEDIAGVTYRRFDATLKMPRPPRRMMQLSDKNVVLTVHVGKKDGRVRAIKLHIERSFPANMRMQTAGGPQAVPNFITDYTLRAAVSESPAPAPPSNK